VYRCARCKAEAGVIDGVAWRACACDGPIDANAKAACAGVAEMKVEQTSAKVAAMVALLFALVLAAKESR
jgi:hypothetical protein